MGGRFLLKNKKLFTLDSHMYFFLKKKYKLYALLILKIQVRIFKDIYHLIKYIC
jgi:hypothetical protein